MTNTTYYIVTAGGLPLSIDLNTFDRAVEEQINYEDHFDEKIKIEEFEINDFDHHFIQKDYYTANGERFAFSFKAIID